MDFSRNAKDFIMEKQITDKKKCCLDCRHEGFQFNYNILVVKVSHNSLFLETWG